MKSELGIEQSFTICQKITFFLGYSLNDVLRRKTLYIVAFSAVFISILSILLIDVFVKKGSLIFVKMSEDVEIDAEIRPSAKHAEFNFINEIEYTNFRLNMTRIDELQEEMVLNNSGG